MTRLRERAVAFWRLLRRISGDDRYERYQAFARMHRACDDAGLHDRRTFYLDDVRHRWNGVRRCC